MPKTPGVKGYSRAKTRGILKGGAAGRDSMVVWRRRCLTNSLMTTGARYIVVFTGRGVGNVRGTG